MDPNSRIQLSYSDTKDINPHQQLLDENSAKLQQIRDEYECKLKQYYSMKGEETVLELKFDSWKRLYREQEAELAAILNRAKLTRQSIWEDREELCAFSSEFFKEFSMENYLLELNRAARMEDGSPISNTSVADKIEVETDPLTVSLNEVEREIEMVKEKEAELSCLEQEQSPEEETIRRLQDAITNSVRCLEEMEGEIKNIKANAGDVVYNQESEVRSILKRPTFVTYEAGKKQVRFE